MPDSAGSSSLRCQTASWGNTKRLPSSIYEEANANPRPSRWRESDQNYLIALAAMAKIKSEKLSNLGEIHNRS